MSGQFRGTLFRDRRAAPRSAWQARLFRMAPRQRRGAAVRLRTSPTSMRRFTSRRCRTLMMRQVIFRLSHTTRPTFGSYSQSGMAGIWEANLDQVSGQPREIQGAEINLSDQLVAAWTNFARTGNPNGSGNSPWPQFTSSSPKLLQQDIPNGIETAAQFKANYKCDFWAAQ